MSVSFLLSAGSSHDILFPGRHEAFFKSKCTHIIQDPSSGQDITFLTGELMKIEESVKVSRDETAGFTFFDYL